MDDELHLGFDYGAADADAAVDEDLLNLDKYRTHGSAPAETPAKNTPKVAKQQKLSENVETLSLIAPGGPAPATAQLDFAPPTLGVPDVNFDVPDFVPLEQQINQGADPLLNDALLNNLNPERIDDFRPQELNFNSLADKPVQGSNLKSQTDYKRIRRLGAQTKDFMSFEVEHARTGERFTMEGYRLKTTDPAKIAELQEKDRESQRRKDGKVECFMEDDWMFVLYRK